MREFIRRMPVGYYIMFVVLIVIVAVSARGCDSHSTVNPAPSANVSSNMSSKLSPEQQDNLQLKAQLAVLQGYYDALKARSDDQTNQSLEQLAKLQKSQKDYETAKQAAENLRQQYMTEINEYPTMKAQVAQIDDLKRQALAMQADSQNKMNILLAKLKAVNDRTDNITDGVTGNWTPEQIEGFYFGWVPWYANFLATLDDP